jgi:hypothetical protein
MKKGLAILFLITYSLSVFGIGLKESFCCGQLKKVTVAVIVNEKHIDNKTHKNNGCCKTQYHYLKVKDNHLGTAASTASAKPAIQIHAIASLWQLNSYSFQSNPGLRVYHSPPLHNGIAAYIFNCVYRI